MRFRALKSGYHWCRVETYALPDVGIHIFGLQTCDLQRVGSGLYTLYFLTCVTIYLIETIPESSSTYSLALCRMSLGLN